MLRTPESLHAPAVYSSDLLCGDFTPGTSYYRLGHLRVSAGEYHRPGSAVQHRLEILLGARVRTRQHCIVEFCWRGVCVAADSPFGKTLNIGTSFANLLVRDVMASA